MFFCVLLFMAVTWRVMPAVHIPRVAIQAPTGAVLPGPNLQWVLDSVAQNGDTLLLTPGRYEAEPIPYTEEVCGNCENPRTEVHATVGFWIHDKALVILGMARDTTVLLTRAGYGVLFERSWGSVIRRVTITGGIRDPNGWATDAGIVVKHSRVTIEDVVIRDNTHRIDTVVVGIGGIMGREGAELFVFHTEIRNNGWDGIALYRGAMAVIADNVIEQGRGAGVGITWDASAVVYRNWISGYWKGIGAFGESRAVVRNNVVYRNLGWGIIATGSASMEVVNNVIAGNGNCGFAVWEPTARGILKNNIIIRNGWKKEWVCPGVGIWMNADTTQFPIRYNDVWENHGGNYKGVPDLTGIAGNLSVDPRFMGQMDFRLRPDSPCRDAGDPGLLDRDGSRSDMGRYGGPWAHP